MVFKAVLDFETFLLSVCPGLSLCHGLAGVMVLWLCWASRQFFSRCRCFELLSYSLTPLARRWQPPELDPVKRENQRRREAGALLRRPMDIEDEDED